MSLQLWLPMTKDLTQQGLQTVSATNVGVTLDNNGKLGKCYSFNGNGNYLLFNYGLPKTVNTWSYCCWAKLVNNSTTMCLYSQRTTTTDDQRTIFIVQGKVFYFDDGVRIQGSLNTSADLTQWNHYAFIRNSNSLKIYINGIETVSTTISSTPATIGSYTMIGASQNTNTTPSGNSLYGYLNDFRLYDHALSPKEIEILSRGLVCHYPLNNAGNGQKNYLKNSNFLQGTNGMEGYTATGATCTKQTDCMKVVSGGASSGFFTSNFDSITTGDMTTFSAWVKADSSMTIYIGTDGSGTGNCQAYTVGNSWQRISISKEKTTNNANLRVYGSGTFYVRHMKYELGSTVTPWIPNPADTAYTAMGYNSTTEYDVSGYNYHGTRVNAFNWDSNTARYSVSTKFNGSDNAIQIPFNQMLGLTAAGKADYTVNVWTYKTSIGTKAYQTILGGASGFELEARNASGTDPQYVALNWGKPIGTYEFNKWCMFTFVHTSSDCKIYVNGEYTSTGSSANVPISNFYIGSWNTYNSQNYEGQMSDFRIYATALSAAQIAELYNTAVSVANNGTLMGYELVES